MSNKDSQIKIASILVTSLFFLWGLSYGLIDVMNKNFQNHLHITQHQSGYLQMAYFGAYFIIALPAGFIAQKFSYKIGILMGLLLYATGCLLIIPATNMASFILFLIAFFILACGLGSLETNANSYMTKLGDEKEASFRINAAQSFNGLGQFLGPIIAGYLFLSITKAKDGATQKEIEALLIANMNNVQLVYVAIAIVVIIISIIFIFNKLPEGKEVNKNINNIGKPIDCLKYRHFSLGLLAQFLYIAAQVGAGAFFINYTTEHYPSLSDTNAAYYFSIALVAFMLGRIITTPFMKQFKAETILSLYSIINVFICVFLYFASNLSSIIALIAIFFFMSICFPTIFAISTKNLPQNQVKLASSLLIMSIVGGAIMPLIMGKINDMFGTGAGYMCLIPCFLYVAWYGIFGSKYKDY